MFGSLADGTATGAEDPDIRRENQPAQDPDCVSQSEGRAMCKRSNTMATIRQDPFRDLLRLAGFDHPAYRSDSSGADIAAGERLQYSSWAPHVDIFEDKESILLKVELPEVEAKDVEITAEGNTLTLRGERKLERADQRDSYTRIERTYGTFSRSFTLPNTIDLEHISAETHNGVLRVTLPKKAETKPRTIKVQAQSAAGLANANAAKQ